MVMLAIGEAARELRVSPGTLRNWAAEGKVKAERTPTGRRLFALSEIERLRTRCDAGRRDR